MPDAVDYSWGRPDPGALARAGVKLVSRYLSHDSSKNLSAAEANALHAAHIDIVLNWESDAGRPLLGAAAGAADGRDAASLAHSLGVPYGCTIYYSCDRDITSGQFDTVAAYYRAAGQATAGRYNVGIYGEADIVDAMHARGVVTSEWQTFAWSGGRQSAEADLYQYLNGQTLAGASVDFDRIIHPDKLGAWTWVRPAEGSFMALTDAQQQEMYAALHDPNGFARNAFETYFAGTGSSRVRIAVLAALGLTGVDAAAKTISDPTSGLQVRVAKLQADLAKVAATLADLSVAAGDPAAMEAAVKAGLDGATIKAAA